MSKLNKSNHIPRFVYTGGPCAGKSTIIDMNAFELQNKRGFTAFIVPEAATILMSMGLRPTDKDFQLKVLELILWLEDQAEQSAQIALSEGKKPIILCDRGALDAMAYISVNAFEKVVKNSGHNIVHLRDSRYDGVIHLVSTAVDKVKSFTLKNNKTRKETVEEAKELDVRTQNSWVGHSHLRVIDNSTALKPKAKKALHEICHALGIPTPSEIERKYLIDPKFYVSDFPKDIYRTTVRIAQTYLTSKQIDLSERVRSRSQGRFGVYSYNQKKDSPNPLVRFEQESKIMEPEYNILLKRADPDYQALYKDRTLFVNQNQYMEFDTLIKPHPGKKYLEVELSGKNQKVFLPKWLPIVDEVTGQKEHSMKYLARR